eukprot:scaffold114_cov200-Alexandrium_tamarense.AAC.16
MMCIVVICGSNKKLYCLNKARGKAQKIQNRTVKVTGDTHRPFLLYNYNVIAEESSLVECNCTL